MKKLKQLAQELHNSNYVMTDKMKEQFEDYLSTIATGARVLHPRFGLGTVKETQGESWVGVEFDKEVEEWEKMNKDSKWPYRRPKKYVMISSCTSIHMLLKKEQERKMKNAIEPLKPFDF